MSIVILPLHRELQATSRLQAWTVADDQVRLREWIILGLAGFCAATATQFLDFSLRIPGHAILRAIFPLTVGLALFRAAALVWRWGHALCFRASCFARLD